MNSKSLTLFAVLLACLFVVTVAHAENRIIEGTVIDKVEGIDKNGQPTTRLILKWNVTLDGHTFPDEHVCMAFGETTAEFASVNVGDSIKAVGDYGKMPDGRESYTLKKLLQ